MENILFASVENTIGQVRLIDAPEEIQKLNDRTGKRWRMDFSEAIFLVDEEAGINNPCDLSEGFVWIVTDEF